MFLTVLGGATAAVIGMTVLTTSVPTDGHPRSAHIPENIHADVFERGDTLVGQIGSTFGNKKMVDEDGAHTIVVDHRGRPGKTCELINGTVKISRHDANSANIPSKDGDGTGYTLVGVEKIAFTVPSHCAANDVRLRKFGEMEVYDGDRLIGRIVGTETDPDGTMRNMASNRGLMVLTGAGS